MEFEYSIKSIELHFEIQQKGHVIFRGFLRENRIEIRMNFGIICIETLFKSLDKVKVI